MESRLQNKLRRADKKILDAQRDYVEVYLKEIREKYVSLTIEERKELIKGLELIIKGIELRRFPDFSNIEIPVFDYKEAKMVREKLRLTQPQVADICGCSQQYISAVERGEASISLKSKGKHREANRKYLEFLKAKGYNPFKL